MNIENYLYKQKKDIYTFFKGKKMKKFFVLIFIVMFCFCGCSEQSINNKETGQVEKTSLKRDYIDGNYEVYGDYYDNDGKVPFLKMIIEGGIIINVNFDYYFKDGSLCSEGEITDEVEALLLHIKSLNSEVLQRQGSFDIKESEEYDRVNSAYKILLVEALDMAINEGTGVDFASIPNTYSYTSKVADKEGYIKTLSITYLGGSVISIELEEKNAQGLSKINDEAFLLAFEEENELGYRYFVEVAISQSLNEKEIILLKGEDDFIDEYNEIAKIINSKIIKFEKK